MEIVIIVVLIVIVAIVWGIASISQSYAAAQQAQATIEVARTAQISSAGTLITILVIVFVLLASLATVVGVLWLLYRLRIKPTLMRAGRRSNGRWLFDDQQSTPTLHQQDSLGLLTQLMTLQMYRQMQADMRHQQERQLSAPNEGNDPWLLP